MNLLNVLAAPNPTTILLLGGAALLLMNIVYGIVRATRGNLKAGWFTIVLALAACIMIAIGTVQTVNASRPNFAAFGGGAAGGAGGTRGNFSGAGGGTGGAGGNGSVGGSAPSGAATADASGLVSNTSGNASSGSGSSAAQVATQQASGGAAQANGTPPANGTRRPRRTPGPGTPAFGGNGGNDGAGGNGTPPAGGFGGNGGNGAGGTAPAAGAAGGFGGAGGAGGAGAGSGTGGAGGTGTGGRRGNGGAGGTGTGNTANAGGASANTSGASGATGGTGGAGTGNASGFQAGGAAGTQATTAITEAQLDQQSMSVALLCGGLGILLGLILYFMERRRPGFISANSRGLLNLGAAFFVVIAILVIPLIPGQTSQATVAAAAARAVVVRARSVPTATPSGTPLPTATATMVPSLTPTIEDTQMASPTQIPYTSTYTVNLQKTLCTGTANTVLSLRPDPSTAHQAIGRVIGGALLQIIGQSADGKWLNVINNDNNTSVQGWVNTSFVTENSSCTGQPLPVVDDNGNAIGGTAPAGATQPATEAQGAAPASIGGATLTLTPTTAAAAAATKTIAPTATSAVTAAACTLFTTSTVYLRADPSVTHAPLAQIPDRTALTPLGKATNGQWWYVTYGDQTGWVGAAAVLASSSCTSAPLITLTPTP